MENRTDKNKIIVILVGPPGSGKGTQADLLSDNLGLVHLETSKIGIEILSDEEKVKNDPELHKIKKLYDSGQLFPPPWTVNIMNDRFKEVAESGKGIVLSGSPRTIYEIENELPVFEKFFGKDGIKVIHLKLGDDSIMHRGLTRRICLANKHPIPDLPEFKDLKVCPKDGSEIIKKTLDKPEIINVRNAVYRKETEPVLEYFKSKGFSIIDIDGEQPIEKVHADILSKLFENEVKDQPGDTKNDEGWANPVANTQ